VDKDNPSYCDIDGVLFSKDKTTIIQFPMESPIRCCTLPDTVSNIYECAFFDCKHLEKISLPESVTHIDGYAFNGCTNLKEINIPSNVQYIGEYAFEGCENITKLTILNKALKLTKDDLEYFTSIQDLTIPYTFWKSFTTLNCPYKKITITTGKTIGKSAFKDISTLEEVVLPNGIKIIPERAFENCTNLKTFIIPPSVKAINDYAFQGCINLEISLHRSVALGTDVFKYCKSVTYLD
jgi:hypothetical protein